MLRCCFTGQGVVFTRTRYEYHLLKTNITAKQYYSRASVNITAPQGARKRCLRRKHSSRRSAVRMLSPHRNNNSVFFRTCAGKRPLESRERGDRKGVNGGKREGERSERESVVPCHKNHEYFITCVNIPWTTYLSSGFDATFVQVESVMMRLFASNFTFLPICDFAYMVLRNSR